MNPSQFVAKPHVEGGHGRSPGGIEYFPPGSEGLVGEGGLGSKHSTNEGHCGAVRIALPGFFKNIAFGCETNVLEHRPASPRAALLSRASAIVRASEEF